MKERYGVLSFSGQTKSELEISTSSLSPTLLEEPDSRFHFDLICDCLELRIKELAFD